MIQAMVSSRDTEMTTQKEKKNLLFLESNLVRLHGRMSFPKFTVESEKDQNNDMLMWLVNGLNVMHVWHAWWEIHKIVTWNDRICFHVKFTTIRVPVQVAEYSAHT